MNDGIELRFTGEITTVGLRSKDIGEVITALEDAVAAIASDKNPGLRRDSIPLSLVKVEEGSIVLTFDTNVRDLVFPATFLLSDMIQGSRWSDLPLRALQNVRELIRFVRRHKCLAQLQVRQAGRTSTVVLSPDVQIPDSVTLFGETELYGEVKRVGGVEPKVELKTLQGETLYCETTEEIAKELGNHLYEQVKVYGAAQWNSETLEIIEFEIHRVVQYQPTSPAQAFREIRRDFGHLFDDIEDPNAWVNKIRYGE
jgi:hypothetical protein